MRRLPLALLASLALAAGCFSSNSTAASSQPGANASAPKGSAPAHLHHSSSWVTYHRNGERSGHVAAPVAPPLHRAWARHLDGAVYGEPLVIGGTVVAATENDSVYGLNPRSGHIRWRTHLATPESRSDIQHDQSGCGNIFPLGITGTPAYDSKTGSVFVVAETHAGHHTLWALNAKTGHRRWHRSTDVLPRRDRRAEQERSALLVDHGRVITTYGGLAGDCGNYVGYVTSTSTAGKGRTRHYAVPTAREAGMWSPAGPVMGANGNVYVASGNGAETNGRWDKSDSVTELTPTSLHRVGVFAPSVWRSDNANDRDLGSSSPVPVPAAHRMLIAGKNGHVYLLKTGLGGVGADIRSLDGCDAFGGAAVRGHTVVMPCMGGIRAMAVHRHSLRWRWTASGVYGSAVIAGHRVYVANRDDGTLRVLSLSSGHQVASAGVGSLTHFPSEALAGNRIFVPTLSGITALRGS